MTCKFSFQFLIDIGNSKVRSLSINQDSEPYIEASKFCAKQSLDAIVITIIGDSIRNQMNNEKRAIQEFNDHRIFTETSQQNPRQNNSLNTTQTFKTEIEDEFPNKTIQMKNYTKDNKKSIISWKSQILPNDEKTKRPFKSHSKGEVFDNLYQNSKQIENKKQLQRKRSFEALKFKPSINQLSKKIVDQKRSKSKNLQSHNSSKDKQNFTIKKMTKTDINYTVKYSDDRFQKVLCSKLLNNQITESFQSRNQSKWRSKIPSRQNSHQKSIYERGETFLRKKKDKQNKLRQQMSRKQMEGCRFTPKIISVYN